MRRGFLLAGVAACVACGEAQAPVERIFADVSFDTLWVRGSVSDTILEIPLHITADSEYVYLADGARKGIAALRAADGSVAWVSGGPGAGPGEFRRPAIVEVLPDGRLAVVDTDLARLAFLGRDGAWLGHVPLEEPQIGGLCGLADGTMLVTVVTADSNVVRVDAEGTVLGRDMLPWPELAARPSLLRQAMLRPGAGYRGCVLATFFGPGLAIHDGREWTHVRSYAELVPLPEARQNERRNGDITVRTQSISGATVSSRALAVARGRILVQFDGVTEHRGRLIDVYADDGDYMYTMRLPERVRNLAASGDVLYVLTEIEGVPTLTALRPRVQQ